MNLFDNGFAEWWDRYPRHDKKKDARVAWLKIPMTASLFELIMTALDYQKQHDRRFREKRFTPLPATWIRAEEWNNEMDGRVEAIADDPNVDAAREFVRKNLTQRADKK